MAANPKIPPEPTPPENIRQEPIHAGRQYPWAWVAAIALAICVGLLAYYYVFG